MSLELEAVALSGGRKERVLHARIPPALDLALKQQARRLHVPVSRLIRDLLADAISRDGAPGIPPVLGWQGLTLTAPTACNRCSGPLTPGAEAFMAITGRGGPAHFVCAGCRA